MARLNEPFTERHGTLYFGGVSAISLAKQFGTPLYAYSAGRIRDNYHRLLQAFQKKRKNFRVFYAIKANNNPNILRILQKEGAGADASGPSEIELALKAGFHPSKILYTGNYPSDEELKFAFEKKVLINLDDISLLPRLLNIGTPDFLSFRINPGIGAGQFKGLIFAGPDAKFGVPENKVVDAYRSAKEAGIKKFGIHMMTGSCIMDRAYFALIAEKLISIVGDIVREVGIRFEFIDIGGSLGIPYRENEQGLDIGKVAGKVCSILAAKAKQLGIEKTDLVMEPGRYIVGDSGMLLARVDAIKSAGKKFIGTDAGMNTLLRPALYGAYHRIIIANDMERNGAETVDVTGKICENTDRLAKDRDLPPIKVGDILAILDTGAYGFAMGSQYNSRPMAAEVLVDRGKAFLIRKRETTADLVRNVVEVSLRSF